MTRTPPRLLVSLALALAAAGCSERPDRRSAAPGAPAAPAASTARAPAGADVVAEVDGQPILAADLDRKAESRLARLRQEEYEIRRQALDELISERLIEKEARRQGISSEALVAREVDGKAESPSESQVGSIYEQNQGRFAGQTRSEAIGRIRTALRERARQQRRAEHDEELRRQAKVDVRLAAPRLAVEVPPGSPSTGPEKAPVTIVEFTDYQCPFCHRAQSVVDEVLKRYEGKVRLVHLDFPLEGHPGAVPAARAARCAGEQGRFWEYHRSLMTVPGTLDETDLQRRAAAVGLDPGKFGSCVASTRHDGPIRDSFEQGEGLGVTGTPAYFINGRMISGARPLEAFVDVIEEELKGAR